MYNLLTENTTLSHDDIEHILEVSNSLQYVADLTQGDIFIDCPTRDLNAAIVVAWAKPSSAKSLYKKSVVGELALRANEPAVLRTLEKGIQSRDLKAITQENITVKQVVTPIHNKKNECIGVLISEEDISKNIEQDNHLKILSETTDKLTSTLLNNENEDEKYEDISLYVNDAIIIFNENKIAEYTNIQAKTLYKKLGYLDKITGMTFENLFLGRAKYLISKGSMFEEEEVTVGDLTLQMRYGMSKNRTIMLIRDLTEVKKKEKELVLKSFAIKEIHHRVKNNLQTVASLLNLQSRRIEDDEYKEMFSQSINRILSIAVTHEILAQDCCDNVDIKAIISKLCDNIDYGQNVKLTVKGDDFLIDSDKASAIAMVVNELLHNAMKHAFNGIAKGVITVNIQKGNTYSVISISDNGIGFNLEENERNTLGLKIVKNIVKDKLGGRVTFESSNLGTTVSFDFKN